MARQERTLESYEARIRDYRNQIQASKKVFQNMLDAGRGDAVYVGAKIDGLEECVNLLNKIFPDVLHRD